MSSFWKYPLFQSGIRSDWDKKVEEQQQSQREACNSENQLGGQELVARAAQEVESTSGGKFIVKTSPHNQESAALGSFRSVAN